MAIPGTYLLEAEFFLNTTIVRAFSHAGIWDNLSFEGLLTADG